MLGMFTDAVPPQEHIQFFHELAPDLPWVQQWTNRSIAFPLYNMLVWGLGLPLGLASVAGYLLMGFELLRRKKLEHLLPILYVTTTFIYHGATFIKFMRYFLPLYPFMVLFAAYFIVWLWRQARAPVGSRPWPCGPRSRRC